MGALNFAVIWLLMYSLMITFALSLGSLCMNLNTLSPSENTVLLNFTYAKQTVPNYVICGRNCNMDTNCKSFNYYNCNDMCELNNSTRSEHSEAFVDDPNGVYFDENPDDNQGAMITDGSTITTDGSTTTTDDTTTTTDGGKTTGGFDVNGHLGGLRDGFPPPAAAGG